MHHWYQIRTEGDAAGISWPQPPSSISKVTKQGHFLCHPLSEHLSPRAGASFCATDPETSLSMWPSYAIPQVSSWLPLLGWGLGLDHSGQSPVSPGKLSPALLSTVGKPSTAMPHTGLTPTGKVFAFPLWSRNLVPKPLVDRRGSGTQRGWG